MPKNKKVCYIEEDENNNNFVKYFVLFNEFQCNIKLHYLLTNKYIIYHNIDKLYTDFLLLTNNFFEEYHILYKADIPTNIENLKLNISYNNDLIQYIIQFRDNINTIIKYNNNNINIINILNHMLILINKFLYIITLDN
tara:strand:+ start:3223 stop:3639 length:417 start_codon:yes stop_codon:yes gene_type:complete